MDIARGAGFAANGAVNFAKSRSDETKRAGKLMWLLAVAGMVCFLVGSHFATMYTAGMQPTDRYFMLKHDAAFAIGFMLSHAGLTAVWYAWKRTKEVARLRGEREKDFEFVRTLAGKATGVQMPQTRKPDTDVDFQIEHPLDADYAPEGMTKDEAQRIARVLAATQWAKKQRKTG